MNEDVLRRLDAIEAALRIRPDLSLIDELAHVIGGPGSPGSMHRAYRVTDVLMRRLFVAGEHSACDWIEQQVNQKPKEHA